MKELIDYQEARIKSLLNKLTEYGRFILELTDEDCTDEYRSLIKNQILDEDFFRKT